MFSALMRTRIYAFISSILSSLSGKDGKKSRVKPILLGLLLVYAFGSIAVSCGMLFSTLYTSFSAAGIIWLYYALAIVTSILLCFIGSIFVTQTQLYDAKDNELLLSMPIPPRMILGSRMATLFLLDIVMQSIIMIPAGIVALSLSETVTVVGVIMFVVAYFALPFISMTLSSIVGWVVALISSRMRNKSLITLILSLVFLFAYFYGFSKANSFISSLAANGEAFATAIEKYLYPFFCAGDAITSGNIVSLFIFLATAFVPFAIIYWVLSKSFIAIATTKRGMVKVQYREKEMKVASAQTALTKKELRRLFTSPMYMLNGLLGAALTIALGVMLIVKAEMVTSFISQEFGIMSSISSTLIIIVLGFLCATNIITAPSVSLEGKSIWIAQSIPVHASKALLAKVYAQYLICIPPTLFASIVACIVLKLDANSAVFTILVPLIFNIFQALFGLRINLALPKLDWVNETIVIKQGASTVVTMFGAWAVMVTFGVLAYFAVLKFQLFGMDTMYSIIVLVLAVASAFLYRNIITKGAEKFSTLS